MPGSYEDGETYSLRQPHVEFTSLAFGPMAQDVMTSMRVAAPQFGLGLLEAIPEEDLMALADPDDADGDGISGRVNHVWDVQRGELVVGRFGWKANQPTIRQQTAGALAGDIGMTSSIFPDANCPPAQEECAAAPSAARTTTPTRSRTTSSTRWSSTVGRWPCPRAGTRATPPCCAARRSSSPPAAATAHVPEQHTGPSDVDALSMQPIFPYTDLLLHDMGDGLADGRPDNEATGSEWRTPPLWGIGLLDTVNDHHFLLHDGRACGPAEAILWHGGEAEAAREAFRAMSASDRDALLDFLESL